MPNNPAAVVSEKNVKEVAETLSTKAGEAAGKVTQLATAIEGLAKNLKTAAETLEGKKEAVVEAAAAASEVVAENANHAAGTPGGARLMDAARKLFGSTNVAMVGGAMRSPALVRALASGGARRFLTETVRQMKSFSNTARKTAKAMRGGVLSASRMANQASRKVGGVVASINSQVPEAVNSINSVTSQFGGMPSLQSLPKIGSKVTASIRAAFKSIARQAAAVAKAKSHRRRVSQKTKLGKQAGGRKSSGFLSSFF